MGNEGGGLSKGVSPFNAFLVDNGGQINAKLVISRIS